MIRIYGIIPKKNYILFIKEIEFPFDMSAKNIEDQKDIVKTIFKNIFELTKFEDL